MGVEAQLLVRDHGLASVPRWAVGVAECGTIGRGCVEDAYMHRGGRAVA